MGKRTGGKPTKAGQKGDGRRLPRVEREIREVIGTYLLGGFRGELPGLTSISRVVASGDLRTAKIMITVLTDSAADRKAAVVALQERAHEIQAHVNSSLRMKHCPKLTFLYDEGFENAMKVEGILHDLEQKRLADQKAVGEKNASPKDEDDDES